MSVYFIATNIYGTSTCHTLGYEPNQCLPFFLDSRETSIAFSRPWDMGHCSRGGGGGESPLCHIESGLVPGALLLMDMQLQFLGQGVL